MKTVKTDLDVMREVVTRVGHLPARLALQLIDEVAGYREAAAPVVEPAEAVQAPKEEAAATGLARRGRKPRQ